MMFLHTKYLNYIGIRNSYLHFALSTDNMQRSDADWIDRMPKYM